MARRLNVRIFFLGIMALTIGMLVYTSHLRESYTPDQRTLQDFYHRTKTALDKQGGSGGGKPTLVVDLDADGDIDEEDARLAREMADRLKAAEQQAKDQANAKAPNKPDRPSQVIGVGSSAGGQLKGGSGEAAGAAGGVPVGVGAAAAGGAAAAAGAGAGAGATGGGAAAAPARPAGETEEQRAVETTLDEIVKRAPVIIFSKTYCPYSKRAKGLLLDKYVIEPAPYVVELDTHPLGPALQSRLGELTGRRTVPNILINGKSIGGSDDIAELDRDKQLVDRVKMLGGKSVEMKERLAA